MNTPDRLRAPVIRELTEGGLQGLHAVAKATNASMSEVVSAVVTLMARTVDAVRPIQGVSMSALQDALLQMAAECIGGRDETKH